MNFFSKKLSDSQETLQKLREEFAVLNNSVLDQFGKIEKEKTQLLIEQARITEQVISLDIKNTELKGVYDNVFTSVNWLKDKYEDFYFLLDEKSIIYPKGRYATKCSEAQKEFAKENKGLRRKVLDLEHQLHQIESLIPDVEEIVDITKEDTILEDIEIITTDKIDLLINENEQKDLSREEILQRALDRYITRKMSKSAVGKDYERYIGYLYEQKGYKVQYHGIKKGLADLGIDLICTKGKETLLIQCKNWSKSKNIHENAINQLFGTSMKYYIEKWEINKKKLKGSLFENIGIPFNEDFQPVFITTTELSTTASEFAKALKIEVLNIPYEKNYPRIKCNIGKDEYGLRSYIYHLPFDQKYDITQNIINGGENVLTIKEAEDKGYRKAFRWRGE